MTPSHSPNDAGFYGMFPPGSTVSYLSRTKNDWIPAVVMGYNGFEKTYCLDCHPEVPSERVRYRSTAHASTGPRRSSLHTVLSSEIVPTARVTVMGADARPSITGESASSREVHVALQSHTDAVAKCRIRCSSANAPDAVAFSPYEAALEAHIQEAECSKLPSQERISSSTEHSHPCQDSHSAEGRPPDSHSAEGPLDSHSAEGRPPDSHSAEGRPPDSHSAEGRPPDSVADLCTMRVEDFTSNSSNPFAPSLLNPFLQDSLGLHARVHSLNSDDQMCADEKFARQLQQELNFPSDTSSESPVGMRKCPICTESIAVTSGFTLDCDHTLCPDCIREHLLSDGRPVEEVGCPCGTLLTSAQLRSILGDALDNIYASRLEVAVREIELEEHKGPPEFRCPLCFDDCQLDAMVSLDCNHKLCTECFSNYLKTKVTDGEVADDELVCPLPDCNLAFTIPMIEHHLTPELWQRFLNFRMKLFRSSSGLLVKCTENCPPFIVPNGRKKVTCPACKKVFCPLCNEDYHEGITCDEYRQHKIDNSTGDKKFEELLDDKQWKRCPKCRSACERSEGCNFMRCESATCRKKTYFCYVCGIELDKTQHYAHFPDGPYRMKCATLPQGPRVSEAKKETPVSDIDFNQLPALIYGYWPAWLRGGDQDPAR